MEVDECLSLFDVMAPHAWEWHELYFLDPYLEEVVE